MDRHVSFQSSPTPGDRDPPHRAPVRMRGGGRLPSTAIVRRNVSRNRPSPSHGGRSLMGRRQLELVAARLHSDILLDDSGATPPPPPPPVALVASQHMLGAPRRTRGGFSSGPPPAPRLRAPAGDRSRRWPAQQDPASHVFAGDVDGDDGGGPNPIATASQQERMDAISRVVAEGVMDPLQRFAPSIFAPWDRRGFEGEFELAWISGLFRDVSRAFA